MENLWPIAVGLSILGLIWAVVMNAKHNADRERQTALDALDAALAGNPNANSHIVLEKANQFLAFLQGVKIVEVRENESTPEPYDLRSHEAG